jgi:hypothetical protein
VGEDLLRAGAVAEQKEPAGVESAVRHQMRRVVGCAKEGVRNGNVADDGVLVAGVHLVPGEGSDQKVENS